MKDLPIVVAQYFGQLVAHPRNRRNHASHAGNQKERHAGCQHGYFHRPANGKQGQKDQIKTYDGNVAQPLNHFVEWIKDRYHAQIRNDKRNNCRIEQSYDIEFNGYPGIIDKSLIDIFVAP